MTECAKRAHPIRVLLIAPSLEIVGGQAVQASYLLSALQRAPEIDITFFALNRPLPRLFGWIQKVPYVRTLVNIALYHLGLLRLAQKHDILHIFTAGLWSYTLWTIPALLIGKLYGKRLIVNYHDGRAEQHLQLAHRRANFAPGRPGGRAIGLSGRCVCPI